MSLIPMQQKIPSPFMASTLCANMYMSDGTRFLRANFVGNAVFCLRTISMTERKRARTLILQPLKILLLKWKAFVSFVKIILNYFLLLQNSQNTIKGYSWLLSDKSFFIAVIYIPSWLVGMTKVFWLRSTKKKDGSSKIFPLNYFILVTRFSF